MRRRTVGLGEVERINPGKVDTSIRVKCLAGRTRLMTGRAKVKARKEEKEKERKGKGKGKKGKGKGKKRKKVKDINSPRMNHGMKVITSVMMASTTKIIMKMIGIRSMEEETRTGVAAPSNISSTLNMSAVIIANTR